MLSRLKDNIKYEVYGALSFERDDPLNAGVEADSLIATATSGYQLRLIRYRCPASGTLFEFLTNEMTLCPGGLAYLYKRRWDIEKTYDSFKNKLGETKAWARSRTAQALQANLLCLTHNLMICLLRRIESDPSLVDPAPRAKAQQRLRRILDQLAPAKRTLSPLYQNINRRSQICLKFLRWLRHHMRSRSLIPHALHCLRATYALY